MYYNECTPSNDLKEYYKQILSSDKFKVSEDRIKKLDVYSKKVNETLCMYYIDAQSFNIDSPEMFYLFADNNYIYPSVVDLKNNIELKSLMKTKIEKFNIDYSAGVKMFNNTSDNNMAVFLSLECPYCGYLYQFLTTYFQFAQTQNLQLNTDVRLFLMSNDPSKTEFFTKVAKADTDLFTELLYDYFSNQKFKESGEQIKKEYAEKVKDLNLPSDVNSTTKNMLTEFNKLNTNGTPVTIINGKMIVGANLGLLSYILKTEKITDIDEITKKMKEHNEKVNKQE